MLHYPTFISLAPAPDHIHVFTNQRVTADVLLQILFPSKVNDMKLFPQMLIESKNTGFLQGILF